MIKNGVSGARTNENGLAFEEKTNIEKILEAHNWTARTVAEGGPVELVDDKQEIRGISLKKKNTYAFLKDRGVKVNEVVSHKMYPDESIYVPNKNHLYVIEKKYQECNGSTDEKLQTCVYKKEYYERLFKNTLGIEVSYMYILNDFFKKDKYRDVFKFIKNHGCEYYFNEIPLKEIFW